MRVPGLEADVQMQGGSLDWRQTRNKNQNQKYKQAAKGYHFEFHLWGNAKLLELLVSRSFRKKLSHSKSEPDFPLAATSAAIS